jgi:hypothetical protein
MQTEQAFKEIRGVRVPLAFELPAGMVLPEAPPLGRPVERAELVERAEWYADQRVPYLEQGRTLEGMDCVGLLVVVGKDLGLTTFDFLEYARPDTPLFQILLEAHLLKIPVEEAGPGDIFGLKYVRAPHHCGLVTARQWVTVAREGFWRYTMVHATRDAAVVDGKPVGVVRMPLDSGWMRKVHSAYRVPSLIVE